MKNSKEMTYREITISDYDEIIRLWKNTPGMSIGEADSRENMEKFFIRNPGLCFCAEQNGRIIGTVLAAHDGRRGFIYHLAVETIFRSKGIGGFLAKTSLKAMKSQGICKCHVFVFKNNEIGMNFWSKSEWKKREDIEVFSVEI